MFINNYFIINQDKKTTLTCALEEESSKLDKL